MVGVNEFRVDDDEPLEILRIDRAHEQAQIERVREVRRRRDAARCSNALAKLRRAASGSDNLMPYILDAVRAYATEGEIMSTLIDVFGLYTEEAVI
jgi:methylmalonyl-CoA mutase N-terminal domain/subunit